MILFSSLSIGSSLIVNFLKTPTPPLIYTLLATTGFLSVPLKTTNVIALNPPPPLRFPPQTINNDSCPLVTILVKRPGKGSLIHGGEYKLGGLFELAFAHLGYKVSSILNISLVDLCEKCVSKLMRSNGKKEKNHTWYQVSFLSKESLVSTAINVKKVSCFTHRVILLSIIFIYCHYWFTNERFMGR